MDRKLGLAVIYAVITFVILLFGLTSAADSQINTPKPRFERCFERNLVPPANYEECLERVKIEHDSTLKAIYSGIELKRNAMLFALIGAVVVAGLALVMGPSTTRQSTGAVSSEEQAQRLIPLPTAKSTPAIQSSVVDVSREIRPHYTSTSSEDRQKAMSEQMTILSSEHSKPGGMTTGQLMIIGFLAIGVVILFSCIVVLVLLRP